MTNQQIARLISPTRKHVWLIAAPKSGSPWLGAILESVYGWPRVPLLDCYDRREQESIGCAGESALLARAQDREEAAVKRKQL